jgi:hypothetical protein
MSTLNDVPERSATNNEWINPNSVGGIWDESMFEDAPPDSRFWGVQDPLDFVPRKLHLFNTSQFVNDSP